MGGNAVVPFKVFDRKKKEMWLVLNYQGGQDQSYLVAREVDSDQDGELKIINASELSRFKLVEFAVATSDLGD